MARGWMPFYVGDFLADTLHLGAAEIGMYALLIMHCWQHGSIPRDDRKLARIAHCDSRLWHRYRETMLRFFDVVDGSTMQHRRVSKELLRYQELSNKRKAAAEQVHEKKRAHFEHLHTPSPSPSPTQVSKKKPSYSGAPRAPTKKQATRLPTDWELSEALSAYALSKGLARDRIAVEAEKFKNYWVAKSGRTATKADWPATWRNWVLNAIERSGLQPSMASPMQPMTVDEYHQKFTHPGMTREEYLRKFGEQHGETEETDRHSVDESGTGRAHH